MGMFDDFKDKATDAASEHSDKVEGGVDKAGDALNEATGGKFEDKIESGKDAVSDRLGSSEDGGDSGDDQA